MYGSVVLVVILIVVSLLLGPELTRPSARRPEAAIDWLEERVASTCCDLDPSEETALEKAPFPMWDK